MKSEPFKYSWEDLVKDGRTHWDGVRNYEARNNLAAMKCGDLAFYYHSNEGKEVVGIAEIVAESYPDPTTEDDRWVVVDIAPVVPFETPVTLATIKADPTLDEIALVRRGRLSVVPITPSEFRRIATLGQTKIPPERKAGEKKLTEKKATEKKSNAKKPTAKKPAARRSGKSE
jgi:predicted RNA-binding protein with PUA-like domain